MRAYNKERFDNTQLNREADRLRVAGFINKKQADFIEQQLPSYIGHSNIFARIGLIILGSLLFSACTGFIALIVGFGIEGSIGWLSLLNAILGFIALEFYLIRRKYYYAHGIDDAFLISAQINLLVFFAFRMDNFEHLNSLFFVALLTGAISCLRYVDRFSVLLACLSLIALMVNFCIEAGDLYRSLLPFIIMAISIALFYLFRWLQKKDSENNYYQKCFGMGFGFIAILFYLSGNYLVVRELGSMLLEHSPEPDSDITFAPFFYLFTLLCPLIFVYFGLRKKNRMLIWIGAICLAFSVFTFRYYFHVMPLELALILGGTLLFALSAFTIRKLKGKDSGLTFEPDRYWAGEEFLNLEALTLIERHGSNPSPDTGNETEFGGGDFGGAGSGGKY